MAKIFLEGEQLSLTIKRLCYMLHEQHNDFSNSCFVALQRTGVPFSSRICTQLTQIIPNFQPQLGQLDVTFYRDDFRRGKALEASPTNMPFLIEGKKVILLDDVLYTGRTIRAALDALQHYGRPEKIELCVLIDRRFNRDLPISADYFGKIVDTLDESYVEVLWGDTPKDDKILLHQ